MKNCPICHGPAQEQFRSHDIPIGDCRTCGHRFASLEPTESHVAEVYGDGYFFAGGAGYSDYLAEEAILQGAGRRYARLMSRWLHPGRMLDVGSAAGFIMEGFRQAGWNGIGVEPNARMAKVARDRFNLDVRAEPFGADTLVGETFDLVTMIQVIAHFSDPLEALRSACSRLRPGGYLLVETWNYQSRIAKAMGAAWHEYSPPSVLHWFSPRSLAQLGAHAGLTPIHRGTPSKWIAAGHAASLLRYKFQKGLVGTIARPLLGMIPGSLKLPYPSEDLFWIVFRR